MILQTLEEIDTTEYLSRRRLNNEILHSDRITEVYEKLPKMKELDNKISDITFSLIKSRLKNGQTGSDNASGEMEKQVSAISQEKKQLLKENGYPEDYLDLIYSCPICQDWGEVNGQVCSCIKKLRIQELYQRSNLTTLLEKENFDTFSYEYYSKEPYKNLGISPYENVKRNVENALKFVENFDNVDDNILMYGGPGLGKTFLSNCIAKALLDSGHTVLYLSSNELFSEILSIYIMSKSETEKALAKPIYEYIYSSDLLIIDDLGTEVMSSFVRSQLFEIINKRIQEQKSTLISSNLSLGELQESYTERVMSRIVDKYKLYPFYGDDIRKTRFIKSQN
ncbi:DNA replication protein DnaC [Lachnospiraceae bacterium NE2001]|nr:DNA replication protein DnaC [Lachnospiraceae bacterium NE2001]